MYWLIKCFWIEGFCGFSQKLSHVCKKKKNISEQILKKNILDHFFAGIDEVLTCRRRRATKGEAAYSDNHYISIELRGN